MRRSRRKLAEHGPVDMDRAFAELFSEKTYAVLGRWLIALNVPERDRQDVAHDVLLAALQSFHTYDPMRSRPERWLNKIAVHVAAHYRDKTQHRREQLMPDPVSDAADPTPIACEEIEAAQRRLLAFDVLLSLDPLLRSVLLAHDIDGIPMGEHAEQQGISLSTAYRRRTWAIEAFAAAYREKGAEHD